MEETAQRAATSDVYPALRMFNHATLFAATL